MNDPVPGPLVPVGRSCDCGHPLVWRDGKPWCAVYGAHAPYIHWRDTAALGAQLVADLTDLTYRRRDAA